MANYGQGKLGLRGATWAAQKKEPRHGRGCVSLNAVITVRHLLREEKQGMKASRRIIQDPL
jgi:hypothetical protein